MFINVGKEYGENLCTMEKGRELYEVLKSCFEKEDQITLDFSDTKLITSHFFNASISCLIKDYDIKTIQKKLDVMNIPDYAKQLLNISIGNAIEFYKKNKN
ncbi:MAG: hypothetical protein CL760_12855 [Chloroflexi bacterium]|nr:hypothetical protein [Chloroflexota bacterium]|tara:strand:+ start:48890 stop:49192 length:303 start_codon:yes stop_codon:yes gene_type:complete